MVLLLSSYALLIYLQHFLSYWDPYDCTSSLWVGHLAMEFSLRYYCSLLSDQQWIFSPGFQGYYFALGVKPKLLFYFLFLEIYVRFKCKKRHFQSPLLSYAYVFVALLRHIRYFVLLAFVLALHVGFCAGRTCASRIHFSECLPLRVYMFWYLCPCMGGGAWLDISLYGGLALSTVSSFDCSNSSSSLGFVCSHLCLSLCTCRPKYVWSADCACISTLTSCFAVAFFSCRHYTAMRCQRVIFTFQLSYSSAITAAVYSSLCVLYS